MFDTEVLVVGAGPVGLTLAVDLGQRGVRCTLVERKDAPQFLPKMERCNARTMEIYRRMGLADKVRAAGLRADVPMDVYIVTALNQPPLVRHQYPSVAEAKRAIDACRDEVRGDGGFCLPHAPVGHRQPRASDLPPETAKEATAIRQERRQERKLDRSLNFCRGC